MVYRFGWVAGVAGGLFALARLERLLRSSVEGLPWEIIVLAAAVLGAAITFAGLAYRLSTATVAVVNLVGMLLTVVRIAVPATTWFIFPTLSSFRELGTELGYALDVIRTGVAPILPISGVIAVLAVLFWLLGSLLSWGLLRDRPYVAVLAPLVVYLQFATMDRRRSGPWTLIFLLLLGLSLLAVSADRRHRGTGLLTTGPGRAAVSRSRPSLAAGALVVVMLPTLLSTNALAALLPRSGLLDWRAPSALSGAYYGSISYNPFASIHQQLISPTNTPLFVAELSGDLTYEHVYFRLLTLESFNGTRWYTDDRSVGRPEEIESFEVPGGSFRGPTASVTQTVTILALQQEWLPAAYSPTGFASGNRAVARGFEVKVDDASLYFHALTYRGMSYTVDSQVPLPDLAVLALGGDGQVSPVFAEASEQEEGYEAVPAAAPEYYELPDRDLYVAPPDGIGTEVATLAENQVRGLETDFERALALEAFFREPGAFRYSIDVDPDDASTDLSAWLLDPESPNYRTGYCEQFATAMAVMAREVDLPSRVVLGFAPGELLEDGRLVVRDRAAHAWVELWMPFQGWVRFDPTPRPGGVNPATSDYLPFDVSAYLDIEVPDLPSNPGGGTSRPQYEEDELPPIPVSIPDERGGWQLPDLPRWAIIGLLAAAVLLGLVPAIKWARRRRRLRALSNGDVSAAWWEIVDHLSDLGDEPSAAATPVEVAAATDAAMAPLARVYGESIYGVPTGRSYDLVRVVTADRSLRSTEDGLTERYSLPRRALSRYRLRSLDPRRWWLRRRRR